jgi:hypothetical protein
MIKYRFNPHNMIIVSLIALILLSSFKPDLREPWIRTSGKQVTVYSRPLKYSATESPDSTTIRKIIQEQEDIILLINKKLGTDFKEKVNLYLFNIDEAKEKIGTNGGGSCDSQKQNIYFTFYDKPIFNTIRNCDEYVGVHEMVHMVANNELGGLRSAFFAEGYSNAIDGNYGSVKEEDHLVRRRIEATVKNLRKNGIFHTPTELLNNHQIPAREFYPEIGYLMNWLFETYGTDKINRLYATGGEKTIRKFPQVTGDSFSDMEKKYIGSQNNPGQK